MPAAPPLASASRRATVLRATALLSLALGVFGATLAWCGTLHLANGDAAVVFAAVLAFALVYAATHVGSTRGATALAFGASLVVGGLVGLGAMGAPAGPVSTWFAIFGVAVWLGAALVRALVALPLLALVHRGASLASRDALDRAMLASALWLLASLTEALLVIDETSHTYTGLSGPALGVALLSLMALANVTALAALARSLRWLALWRRVQRGDGWRVVEAASWPHAIPAEPWFHDAAPLGGVLVRRVPRDAAAYREADLEVAHTRVPHDIRRVSRRLGFRVAAAITVLGVLAFVVSALGTTVRW